MKDLGTNNVFSYLKYKSQLNEWERKNAPEELNWEGDIQLLKSGRKVSVVGSRKPSEKGIARAEIITKKLVENEITVVSGLAEGIDTVAHKTAIKHGGKTIAVLGTPLNVSYPISNKSLLHEIKENHLAISQFSVGYPFNKSNFPIRNRTMALISDATIIVEAKENSGTRHQGWEAIRLGRQVYIMENVINAGYSWPKEMINYGAEMLTRDNLDTLLSELPHYTSRELVF